MNPDKYKLIISNRDKDLSIIIDNDVIECSRSVKLLGVTIDNKLDFNEHISKLCKTVSTKLHDLARVSNIMSRDKLRLLMKAFIESQFSYCPLVSMFHSRTLNNRINRLHERGLRMVYKDYKLTFNELLHKDNSFSIHHRNLQRLAMEMYKGLLWKCTKVCYGNVQRLAMEMYKGLLWKCTKVCYGNVQRFAMEMYKGLLWKCTKVCYGNVQRFAMEMYRAYNDLSPTREIPNNLRNCNPFKFTNVHTVFKGTETISFRGHKIWSLIPDNIKHAKSLTEFKTKIREVIQSFYT